MRTRVGGLACALVASACGWAAAPSPAAAAGQRVFLLGDSVMAGLRFSSAAEATLSSTFDVTLDAKVCRALREPSCSTKYDGQPPAALTVLRASAGRIGDALVMMAGYNDANIGPGVDAIMAEVAAQGVPHVLWLTYRNSSGRYSGSNATLWAKTAEYPTLTVADWNAWSAGHGDWFGGDGLHLTGSGAMALAQFIVANLETVFAGGSPTAPARCSGTTAGTPVGAGPAGPASVAPAGGFTPAGPVRMANTRDGAPLGGGNALGVDLSSAVPAGATAALVTLTATGPCDDGFLTAYACGTALPVASNVNYTRRHDRANTAVVLLGTDRHLCVYSYATTDVVVDLSGWWAPGQGWRYQPSDPARLVDTRDGKGARAPLVGKRAAGSTLPVMVTAWPSSPLAPAAVLLNVTATNAETPGFVTVAPCGAAMPVVSTLNLAPGEVVANVAVAAVGGDGTVCIFTSAAIHLVVDLEGWFGAIGALLAPQTPQRIVDTRTGLGGAKLGAATALTVTGSGAGAWVNATAVDPHDDGFLTVHPCGPLPLVSNANYRAGAVVPALAAVGATGGTFCITSRAATELVVDRLGTLVS
jgi:hypothetical protein